MKKILLTTVMVASVALCQNLQAQHNAIKVNILSPLLRTLNLSYERALNESSSLQLGVFYTGVSVADVQYRGFGITPEYRFYLSKSEAPDGFYVAPFLRYQNVSLTEEETDAEATLSSFGGGAIIGRQWVFKKRVTLDLFIGPSYGVGDVKAKSGSSSDDFDVNGAFSGFGLRTGLTLGIAF